MATTKNNKLNIGTNKRSYTVKAKITKSNGTTNGQIIISSENYYRVIPAVLFSPEEANKLLEIIDKVEKDTHANILY